MAQPPSSSIPSTLRKIANKLTFYLTNLGTLPSIPLSADATTKNPLSSLGHINTYRHRFFRVHKYVSHRVSELESSIAKTNFADNRQIEGLRKQFDGFIGLMTGHAKYEDEAINPLLKEKNPQLFASIMSEHSHHLDLIHNLKSALDEINPHTRDDAVDRGYKFYIAFRGFVRENLKHLDQEEMVIMPEIHKHYTDQELKEAIEFKVYKIMTPDEMIGMMKELFPWMNLQDKEAFLRDIQECEPRKFSQAWEGIAPELDEDDRNELIRILKIQ